MAGSVLNHAFPAALRAPTGPPAPRPTLAESLVASGVLDADDLRQAQEIEARQNTRLSDILIARGMVPEADLITALARYWQAGIADLPATPPDPRLVERLGLDTCLRERFLPWRHVGGATVIVTPWPEDFLRAEPRLRALFGPVVMALAPEQAILAALLSIRQTRLRQRAESSVHPAESCRLWPRRRAGLYAAAGGLAVLGLLIGAPVLLFALLAGWAIFTLIVGTALRAAALAARLPGLLAERRHATQPVAQTGPPVYPLPTVSIMVPMFREGEIAARLVARLHRLDYPREHLDILLVIEEEDHITRDTLRNTALPPWIRIITVPDGPLKTKPRALNFALDFCRGSLIGVYDAEDAPEPDQIHKVVRRFHESGPELGCVQGILDFYNSRTNWMARCFTIEYAVWFRVMMPGLERLGMPLPLGGTTLFLRREVLEKLGRWDAHNVTEDADLGIRLARHGYRTEMIRTVTREEANCRPYPWIRQRSRWLKGYAITWAVHMRTPGLLLRQLGWGPFLGMQAIFLTALSQVVLAPVLWSFWLVTLGLPHPATGALPHGALMALGIVFILAEVLNIANGIIAVSGPRHRFLIPWVPTIYFYYPLAALAGYKGLYELLSRPFYWDKTPHGLFDSAED